MKKFAATALVLALGLAACTNNNADNNVANETAVIEVVDPHLTLTGLRLIYELNQA